MELTPKRQRLLLAAVMSGLLLAMLDQTIVGTALPLLIGTAFFFINPDYMSGMLQPGWPMIMPITAVVMVVLGNIVMKQVTKIEI